MEEDFKWWELFSFHRFPPLFSDPLHKWNCDMTTPPPPPPSTYTWLTSLVPMRRVAHKNNHNKNLLESASVNNLKKAEGAGTCPTHQFPFTWPSTLHNHIQILGFQSSPTQ